MDLTVNEKGQREVRGHTPSAKPPTDWRTYSSDLTGDRDVRSAAASHEVRGWGAATIHERGAGAEGGLVRSARHPADLGNHRARGGGDISTALALLYVIGWLTIVSNPPQDYPAGPDGRGPSTRVAGAGRGPSPDGRPKDYVQLHFLSANGGPSVWTDPDRLDIHRERRPHLALDPAVTHASA